MKKKEETRLIHVKKKKGWGGFLYKKSSKSICGLNTITEKGQPQIEKKKEWRERGIDQKVSASVSQPKTK